MGLGFGIGECSFSEALDELAMDVGEVCAVELVMIGTQSTPIVMWGQQA
jgi:hypothetical protein